GNGSRNGQLNFRPRPGFGPNIESRSDSLRAFANSGYSPVSGASSLLDNFRVHAFSIIAKSQAKLIAVVTDLGFDHAGFGVTKRIPNHFVTNPVQFVLQLRAQRSRLTLHDHAESRRISICIGKSHKFFTRGR